MTGLHWEREVAFFEWGGLPVVVPNVRWVKRIADDLDEFTFETFRPKPKPRSRRKQMTDAAATPAAEPSTAVAARPSSALTTAHKVEGLEDFGARDLIVPDLKIGQGTTQLKEDVSGKLYNSLDPSEKHDKIRIAFLTFRHGQVLFPRKADGKPDFDAEIPCRSDDGKVPSKDIEKPISPRCRDEFGEHECPSAKWTAGNKKPACAETHNFVVIDVTTGIPYRFSVKGGDVTTSKKLLSAIKFRATAHKRSLYDFEVTLSTTKNVTEDGVWYSPIFSDIAMVDAGKYVDFHRAYARAKSAEDKTPPAGEASGPVVDAAKKAEDEKKKEKPKSKGGKELDF